MDDSKWLQMKPDYVISDTLSHYKRADPKITLHVINNRQAAVDGGGVLR